MSDERSANQQVSNTSQVDAAHMAAVQAVHTVCLNKIASVTPAPLDGASANHKSIYDLDPSTAYYTLGREDLHDYLKHMEEERKAKLIEQARAEGKNIDEEFLQSLEKPTIEAPTGFLWGVFGFLAFMAMLAIFVDVIYIVYLLISYIDPHSYIAVWKYYAGIGAFPLLLFFDIVYLSRSTGSTQTLFEDMLESAIMTLDITCVFASLPAMIYFLYMLVQQTNKSIDFPWWHYAICIILPVYTAKFAKFGLFAGAKSYKEREVYKEEQREKAEQRRRKQEEQARLAAEHAAQSPQIHPRVYKQMKKQGLVCPHCGSLDVVLITSRGNFSIGNALLGNFITNSSLGYLAGFIPSKYKQTFICNNCGKKYKKKVK
ncbi:hypothetical protein KPC83_01980 [Collinsella sp. zg1085]|uniref:hypothetical protein n=1 Tax=Collinsella sp. zg1085 TaxID=2844380 RepID=UPI001C0C8D06|nr:hypothetical protein [Collinsella sp. zg1085]QWT17935.1 hypothetical protein KPC83_01980 [Collinsella sp. zg1085]